MAHRTKELWALERQAGGAQADRDRLQVEVATLKNGPQSVQAQAAKITTLLEQLRIQTALIRELQRSISQAQQDRDRLAFECDDLVQQRDDLATQIELADGEIDLLRTNAITFDREMEDLQYILQRTEGSLRLLHHS
ncbi:hypothetical protein P3T76_015923 [Phytophthora citrophthora]|uniref:Uncharacterized protein n=1 Tax=Phytophthora citrophthora TaxID=4793 RepID=A0AAD9FYH7_9STRA|nr:hypothetical protein P3T76_015923 [Phytophthora citrophthora]